MSANRTSVSAPKLAARPVAVSIKQWPVCSTPVRPRISYQRSRAAATVPGLPSARPSSSSIESQPSTSAPPPTWSATARALASASTTTSSPVVGAVIASSSTPLTITSGRTPADRSVDSRAGEAEARMNLDPKGLRDDGLHDLAGPAVDAGDAGVRVPTGHRVFEHVTVAAVQLHAAVDDPALQLGAVQLGLGGVGGVELAEVEPVDAAVDVGLRNLQLGRDLGQDELGVLERRDRRAERGAFLDVAHGLVERRDRLGEGVDRDRHPLLGQLGRQLGEAFALGSEEVLDRHPDVGERQLGGVL